MLCSYQNNAFFLSTTKFHPTLLYLIMSIALNSMFFLTKISGLLDGALIEGRQVRISIDGGR